MVYSGSGPDREWISEWEIHQGNQGWIDRGENLYESILDNFIEDYPELDWDYLADLLFEGWFDPLGDIYTRAEAQFDFWDFSGINYEDFPWDDWRDWYQE